MSTATYPYSDAVPKTAGDAAFPLARGFYVGSSGTLTVVTATGETRALGTLAVGFYPLSVTRFVSGTASGLLACY